MSGSVRTHVIHRFWTRIRVQLGGAVILGTLIPFSIGAAIVPGLAGLQLFLTSFIANALAIVVGFWLSAT